VEAVWHATGDSCLCEPSLPTAWHHQAPLNSQIDMHKSLQNCLNEASCSKEELQASYAAEAVASAAATKKKQLEA